MARNILKADYDFDFILIGISSAEKDYRLCHFINKALGFDLQKSKDIEIIVTKKRKQSFFTSYEWMDEDGRREIRLLINSSGNEFLVPEMKQMDYLLFLKGPITDTEQQKIISILLQIPGIQVAMPVDVLSLRSKKNLVF